MMLNIDSLARDCGIAPNTVKGWLSVLESSFLALRLQPYFSNIGKRLVKTPKLYLRDTGLICSLIGIESASSLAFSPNRAELFETAVIEEISKAYYARGRRPKLFYWRDAAKREIDIIIEKGVSPAWAIEVKSSSTYNPRFFKNLDAVCDELGVSHLVHKSDKMVGSGHLYLTRMPGLNEAGRNHLIERLAERGVSSNVHYKPLPMMTAYKSYGWDIKDFPHAYDYYANLVTLPLHTRLTDEDVDYICNTLRSVLNVEKVG
jgi:hypothetical protein